MQVDQLVFRHLVDAGFPRLSGHLGSLDAGMATQWYVCLFADNFEGQMCACRWTSWYSDTLWTRASPGCLGTWSPWAQAWQVSPRSGSCAFS